MDTVFIMALLMFGVLIAGFVYRSYAISSLAAFFIMALGVYCIINGIAGTNDWLTSSFGIICICLGGYVAIRGGLELL